MSLEDYKLVRNALIEQGASLNPAIDSQYIAMVELKLGIELPHSIRECLQVFDGFSLNYTHNDSMVEMWSLHRITEWVRANKAKALSYLAVGDYFFDAEILIIKRGETCDQIYWEDRKTPISSDLISLYYKLINNDPI
jgi:hypothetical protein